MGEVIALPPSRNVARLALEGSAEILFFTGVRYYRLSDEEVAELAAPRTRHPAERKGAAKAAPAARKEKRRA